ncbi:MAG: putative NinB protein [Prokaryotic dsDNA virus sp.]|nr:MAG: putative NinB protein [Prokaryotic dsDNA virus sp.]
MIEKYKLVTSNKSALIEMLEAMLSQNEAVQVTAKPWKKERSLSQNALYWVWLTEIAEQVNVNDQYHDKEVWHHYFKRYWCPEKIIPMPVGEDEIIKSTTKLDTGEMHHYLSKIEQWCMEKMIKLTIPENSEYARLTKQQES